MGASVSRANDAYVPLSFSFFPISVGETEKEKGRGCVADPRPRLCPRARVFRAMLGEVRNEKRRALALMEAQWEDSDWFPSKGNNELHPLFRNYFSNPGPSNISLESRERGRRKKLAEIYANGRGDPRFKSPEREHGWEERSVHDFF